MCARAIGALGGMALLTPSLAQAQPVAPFRVGPYLHDLGSTSVEIRAAIDPPGPLEIAVSKAGDAGAPRTFASKAAAMHTVAIAGLEPRTRYEYVATSGGGHVRGELVTAPPDDDKTPFVALVYGDNRTDDHAHELVVRAMLGAPSDLLLHTGDFVDDASREVEWKSFFDVEAPLLRDRCVFATIGNHELLDGGKLYRRFFGPAAPDPGARAGALNDTTTRWQFVRFWFVDAQDDSPARWLLPDLAKHDGEPGVVWRVIVLHQGPFSSGPHGANPLITTSTLDAWREHGVDLVLSGHDHIYERGFTSGLRWVVSGGGGAPPYRIEDRARGSRKTDTARHFVRLELAPERVKLATRRPDGSLVEEVSFDKSVGWSDDPPKREAAPPSASKPEEKAAEVPWGTVAAVAAALGATGLLLGALRRRYRR